MAFLPGFVLVVTACLEQAPGGATSTRSGEVALPAPRLESAMSLEQALQARRSVRDFTEQPLSDAELGQLLWAGQGITAPARSLRTAPSAGAKYPLELYAARPEGLYHYVPARHSLERLAIEDRRARLAEAGLGQPALSQAPVILVVVGVTERTRARYGDRADRFVALEAGHATQNILLQATALGLGAVPIGAFEDAAMRTALGLDERHQPLYLVPVGHAREAPPGT